MNGMVPPSPNARAGPPNVAWEARCSDSSSHGANAGAFQPGPASRPAKRHPGAVGRVGGEGGGDRGERGVGVARRRQPERELERGGRPQHVARPRRRGQAVRADDRQRRPPRVVQDLLDRVEDDGAGAGDEVVAVGVAGRVGRGVGGLAQAVVGDGDVQLGEADLAGHGVLDALQQLAGDAERARHDAAGRAGVDALVQDVDDERAPGQPPQRRGDPQPLVVVAAGVEAQHERGRAQAPGQRLEVGGQVGRAALLAGLDQHDAAGVGAAGLLHRLDGGEGRERRVAVVGPASAVEPAVLDDGRPRPQPLPPAVHLGLLVQVAVEQDGVGRVGRRRRPGPR